MKNILRIKSVLLALLSVLLVIAMFWLAISQEGKKIQLQVFGGSYLPAEATVTETYVYIDPPRATNGKTGDGMYDGGVFLYMKAYYSVDAEQYSNQFDVKKWPWRAVKDSIMTKEADAFKETYLQPGDNTTIYYDPGEPEKSVLNQEDELHFWFIFLIFMPGITFLVIFAIYQIASIFSHKTNKRSISNK